MSKTNRDSTAAPARFGAGGSLVPLHHQVYLLLLQKLSDRSFPADRPIPPESQLSELLGVSRITLRRAMERLEHEGLVWRCRGRGTFPLPDRLPQVVAAASSLRDQVSLASKTKVRVLNHAVLPVTPDNAALLSLGAGAEMLRIVRVRYDGRSPISYSACHLPIGLAPLLPRRRIGALPISVLLAMAGLRLGRVSERLSACIADVGVAGHLAVDVASPLLSMVRILHDADGRPVEHLHALYRPDRYEYRLDYPSDADTAPDPAWQAKLTELPG